MRVCSGLMLCVSCGRQQQLDGVTSVAAEEQTTLASVGLHSHFLIATTTRTSPILSNSLRLMSTAHPQNDPPGQDPRRSFDSVAGQDIFLPPPDPTALRTNSPYRYHPHDIFVTSKEEVQGSQQSPPTYRRVATSSQVALDSRSFTELETPPYKSRVNLGEKNGRSADNPMAEDEKAPLKGVHYPSGLDSPPAHRPPIIRADSDAPSVAGTDEEYEEDSDYDWSGEEDLVDEEAKFEEQMGNKQKPKGWGPRR